MPGKNEERKCPFKAFGGLNDTRTIACLDTCRLWDRAKKDCIFVILVKEIAGLKTKIKVKCDDNDNNNDDNNDDDNND